MLHCSRPEAIQPRKHNGRAIFVLQVNTKIGIPLDELAISYSRSSGPGGQNVNKVNSKVLLRWSPGLTRVLSAEIKARLLKLNEHRLTKRGELLITCDRYRDQSRNLAECLNRLRALVQAALVAPRPRKPSKPSKAAKQTRLDEKRHRSTIKAARRRSGKEAED